MKLIASRDDPDEMEDLNCEKVSDFKYLGISNVKHDERLVKGYKYSNK